jgi:ubiquinone/menaquinone biosynthesis C-methylase UbiE
LKSKPGKPWWEKWDRAAPSFDLMNAAVELRFGAAKRKCFTRASGRTLLAAVGTGLDLCYFPEGIDLVAIDISEKMIEKAAEKTGDVRGTVRLVRADVQLLGFADGVFDTAATSCTFCSVPDPVMGLREIFRVLRPGGKLLMFEHVRSDIFWMGPMLDLVTPLTRRFGPDLNRRTRENIIRAGFRLSREENVYLDMVKLFEAEKPFPSGNRAGGAGSDQDESGG